MGESINPERKATLKHNYQPTISSLLEEDSLAKHATSLLSFSAAELPERWLIYGMRILSS